MDILIVNCGWELLLFYWIPAFAGMTEGEKEFILLVSHFRGNKLTGSPLEPVPAEAGTGMTILFTRVGLDYL